MNDIHGNVVKEGDNVYALTSARVGTQYKRLFWALVEEVSENKCVVFCYESKRRVSLTSASIIKPLE